MVTPNYKGACEVGLLGLTSFAALIYWLKRSAKSLKSDKIPNKEVVEVVEKKDLIWIYKSFKISPQHCDCEELHCFTFKKTREGELTIERTSQAAIKDSICLKGFYLLDNVKKRGYRIKTGEYYLMQR